MIQVSIYEAKTHLSRYIKRVRRGEVIVLCQRNVPVAEIRPLRLAASTQQRPVGLAKGKLTVPEEFFSPLPKEVTEAFEGR
jgi:prevent-host-death family protein